MVALVGSENLHEGVIETLRSLSATDNDSKLRLRYLSFPFTYDFPVKQSHDDTLDPQGIVKTRWFHRRAFEVVQISFRISGTV